MNSSNVTDSLNGEMLGRCRILELPAELRDYIFAFALSFPDGCILDLNGSIRRSDYNPLALLQTCRQIRHQCGDLICEQNEMEITVPFLQHAVKGGEYGARDLQTAFHELLFTRNFGSKLRQVHLRLGRLLEAPCELHYWNGVWQYSLECILNMYKSGIDLRVSFEFEFEEDAVVPFELPIRNTAQVLEDVVRCERMGRVRGPEATRRLHFLSGYLGNHTLTPLFRVIEEKKKEESGMQEYESSEQVVES